MSSKKQPRSLHGKKTEQKPGLSRHYREIGIKAVAAATRQGSTSPRVRGLDGDKPQKAQSGRRTQ
jgi:hypothetical protein